jgi:inhibitor of cysteine peptidase
MKLKFLLALAVIGVSLAVSACSTAQAVVNEEQTLLEVTIDQFMNDKHIADQIEMNEGDILTVILGSNQTTGFQWDEQAQIGDQDILQQTGQWFIAPPLPKYGESLPPGTAGNQEWTFKALQAGTTTVAMEYSRPWEGGEKGEWTFNLTVVIK